MPCGGAPRRGRERGLACHVVARRDRECVAGVGREGGEQRLEDVAEDAGREEIAATTSGGSSGRAVRAGRRAGGRAAQRRGGNSEHEGYGGAPVGRGNRRRRIGERKRGRRKRLVQEES
jgi:hypothetical protein